MTMRTTITLLSTFASALLVQGTAAKQTPTYDLVIYGPTSAGVAAAVQAKRMGKSVIIVGPDKHLGGLSAGGLGWTDSGKKEVIGGISREFYQRIRAYYDKAETWKWQKPDEYKRYRKGDDAQWTFEPHIAEAVFEDLIEEYEIAVQDLPYEKLEKRLLEDKQVLRYERKCGRGGANAVPLRKLEGVAVDDSQIADKDGWAPSSAQGTLLRTATATTATPRRANSKLPSKLRNSRTGITPLSSAIPPGTTAPPRCR